MLVSFVIRASQFGDFVAGGESGDTTEGEFGKNNILDRGHALSFLEVDLDLFRVVTIRSDSYWADNLLLSRLKQGWAVDGLGETETVEDTSCWEDTSGFGDMNAEGEGGGFNAIQEKEVRCPEGFAVLDGDIRN